MVLSPASSNSPSAFPPFALTDGRLRIPTHLPPTPYFSPVTLDALDLDGDLVQSGTTLEFALAYLQRMAYQLLQAEASTVELDEPPKDSTSAPPLVRCRPPPRSSPSIPTHLLELTFTDTHELYRTPVHGLVWALQCPPLAHLSRQHVAREEDDALLLPLAAFDMPHRPAWPLLHRYLYDGSAAQLLNGLLGAPAPPPATGAAGSRTGSGGGGGAPRSPAEEEQQLLDSLLIRLMRVREVWLNAVRLEMSDCKLWDTLSRAWAILVTELGEVAARIPGSSVPAELVVGGV
ncbi:hypothetical protein JCM10449v2_000742 [Rhodotorula kratochvilovae]